MEIDGAGRGRAAGFEGCLTESEALEIYILPLLILK